MVSASWWRRKSSSRSDLQPRVPRCTSEMNSARNRRVAVSVTAQRSSMVSSCANAIAGLRFSFMTATFTFSGSCGRALPLAAAEAHQRVEAERLDLAPLDQFGAAMVLGPGGQPLEREFRPQANAARLLRQQALDRGGQTALGIQ